MTNEEAVKRLEKIRAIYQGMDNKSDVKALDMAVQALEQTDGDLISRDFMKKLDATCIAKRSETGELVAISSIDNLPSAENTAEWIKQKSGDELFPEEIVCSKCYHSNSHLDFDEHNNPIGKVFLESKYCPNCGAKMKEVYRE